MMDLVPTIDAFRVPLEHTSDVSGLHRLIKEGRLRADDVIGVTGKTEGWQADDTSRLDADRAIRGFLLDQGSRPAVDVAQIPMVFTAGGVGILTPHIVVYTRTFTEPVPGGASRLSIGIARSTLIRPEWMTTPKLMEVNADAVRRAAFEASVDPRALEYVVGKTYFPTRQDFVEARAAGHQIPELELRALHRKASGAVGLGVAIAAEEMSMPTAEEVGERLDLWSGRAAISANEWEPVGGDGAQTQLIAFGNRSGAGGRLRVGHAVMADMLDVAALPRAIRRAGLDVDDGPLSQEHRARIIAVYVKHSVPADGRLRGRRQVMESPEYMKQAKAALGGMFSAFLQDNLIWISGSATHQGPVGGGTVAVVVDVSG